MNRIKTAIAVLVLLCALGVQVGAQGGALVNPSMEGGWHIQGAPELTIPNGWTLEYRDGSHPWCPPPCKRPESTPNKEFAYDGEYSVRVFPPAHSRGLWGIYQEIAVTPGETYRFACKTRTESLPEGENAAYVGIQPWGGGLFERQMIWGKETHIRREWVEGEVVAPAYGTRIRVAFGANNKWSTQNNTTWWDGCTFERVSGPGPQPTPLPTWTPQPTPQPCATCVPGGSCVVDYDRIENIVADRPPVWWPR